MADRWIQGAIKHPGALHADLGIPQGQRIPHATLLAAAKQDGAIGRRANLALTLGKMNHGRKLKRPEPKRIRRG